MPKQPTPAQLKALYKKKLTFIDKSLSDFDSDLAQLETQLFDLLITEYVSQFVVKDGVILLNEKNVRLLADLDKVMLQFKDNFAKATFATLGENMLKMTGLTSDYFRVMTGSKKVIEGITAKLGKYRAAVGLDAKGELIKGSFLDNLASTSEMKTALSKYMQTAVTTEMDYRTFSNGLKDMVKGSADVDGALTKYVGGYAHDTFFQQARQQDNFFAETLGLDYFVWEGMERKTSRPLCIKNHGKVFSREQLEALNSKDWQGKIPDVNIFDQVGGYNCSHLLRAVTDEGAKSLGFEEDINNSDTE
jgi:hypothetical protein